MNDLLRKGIRAAIASGLILALLGLGGIDAALCHGPDGHLCIDTRVSSCCRSEGAAEIPSGDHGAEIAAASVTQGLGPAADSSCSQRPLLQSTPAAYSDGPAAVPAVNATLASLALCAREPARGPDPLSCPDPLLSRLRTTTLLI